MNKLNHNLDITCSVKKLIDVRYNESLNTKTVLLGPRKVSVSSFDLGTGHYLSPGGTGKGVDLGVITWFLGEQKGES